MNVQTNRSAGAQHADDLLEGLARARERPDRGRAQRVVEGVVAVGQALVEVAAERDQLVGREVEVVRRRAADVEHPAVDPEVAVEVAERGDGGVVELSLILARPGGHALEESGGEGWGHVVRVCPVSVLPRA